MQTLDGQNFSVRLPRGSRRRQRELDVDRTVLRRPEPDPGDDRVHLELRLDELRDRRVGPESRLPDELHDRGFGLWRNFQRNRSRNNQEPLSP